jgi:carboxyl-terminal processing protease
MNELRRYLVVLVLPILAIFCSLGFALAARPAAIDQVKTSSPEADVVGGAEAGSESLSLLEQACQPIYRGDFGQAQRLIEGASAEQDANLAPLLRIVDEYREIEQRRQAGRRQAYRQQLAELDKLRRAWDSNDPNEGDNLAKVLSVVFQAREFANDEQKESLLSDSFVQRIVEDAQNKGAELESQGKWLDAYINCYSWLQTIWPENKAYSTHAEQLAEKAGIASSFQDSPCESQNERYEHVEREMFIRAVDALNFNYVNVIDYRQMAVKAIRRCELLAEVMKFMHENQRIADSNDNNEPAKESDERSKAPKGIFEPKRLAAWSAALAALKDEVGRSPAGITKDRFIDLFKKVLDINSTTLELAQNLLIAQFAEGALSALDPYTVMIWPQQVQGFEKEMTREFTGIGIEIDKERGLLTVMSLLPDTPAYRSGLDAGDVIEKVDGIDTKDMSLMCAVRMITGPAGTDVMLQVRRAGDDNTRDIRITRAKITVPTIRGWQRDEAGNWVYFVDEENKIGYVRVTSFTAQTPSDLEQVLSKLEAEGLKGLILDLRFNSGGLLDSAVDVTDKFIEEGLIVKTQPRFIPTWQSAGKEGTHPDYPLVLLINRYSASASEIVSGALQDKIHKRAVLVGERTHGKGSVQGITPYPSGGAQLKYTMAYYHLPSGQRVESQDEMKKQGKNDWGIAPDVKIKLRRDELTAMGDIQRDNDVLVRADHDNSTAPLKRHKIDETLQADPQLAVAILVARTKLIQQEATMAAHVAAAM